MARAESDLLNLREVFIDCAVELKLANRLDGNKVCRPQLGGIKDVEVEIMLVLLFDYLDGKGPFGVGPTLDSLLEVLAMKIWGQMSKSELLMQRS